MSDAVAFFSQRYKSEGDRAKAEGQRAYMKSALRFHGVTLPQIRRAAADYVKARPGLDHDALVEAVEDLFATDWFDLRHTAVALLDRKKALVGPRDEAWIVSLVRRAACWAMVDWLAAKLAPRVLADNPRRQLVAWARDEDFWVRRTALLAQLDVLRAGGGEFELFCALATPMLGEREFFIRKAIGWVLREVSKKRPALVRAYLREHGEAMSGLTRREAERHLQPRRA